MNASSAASEQVRLGRRILTAFTVAGVVVGVGGSYAISRALRSLDYGITTVDPLTLAMTSVALVTIALIASIIPARRATRVDPMVALRSE